MPTAAESQLSWLEHVERTQGGLNLDEARELHEIAGEVRELVHRKNIGRVRTLIRP